ncbi:MAG: hydroxyacid dehydrogenase [Ruminococcaceae bacterium]|nr:hydroxyacid dehydrogenase [Oscillospiraceae bacterium]
MEKKIKITILDSATLGKDIDLTPLYDVGEVCKYEMTSPEVVSVRIAECDAVVLNKVKLDRTNLPFAKNLKVICVAATGYDNIDLEYCRENNIAVCNVAGYSSHSVAQLTAAMVLSLSVHLNEYTDYVNSGKYTAGGVQNHLSPTYHELCGKTWGIIGYGGIGKQVAKVAEAFGCRVLVNKRTPEYGVECVSIDELCRQSDVVTLHTPLNDETRSLIDKAKIALMKNSVILVNVARGAVVDEQAVADAVLNGKIGAFGCDVYSVEPFSENHPYNRIKCFPNVCLTPHMAWGAYEARNRCLSEVAKNIKSFFAGERRNRIV